MNEYADTTGSLSTRIPDRIFWILVIVILFVGLMIRTYGLGTLPDGFYRDEAANGYDSYSIAKTGKSLHGDSLPLFFNHHHLDHVESLYTYLSVPIVYLLGLSVFSTRLLAALAGTITILTACLLARELSGRLVGLITASIVAFSPWHVVFSRIAFRGILLPLFATLACYLFLKSLKNHRYIILCGLVFGLTLHTYAVAKFLVPFLLLCLLILHRTRLVAVIRQAGIDRAHVLFSCLTFLLLAIPVYHFAFLGPGNDRFTELSVFGVQGWAGLFAQNLLAHVTPDFLFLDGDANTRHSLPGYGQLSFVLLPFVLLGIWVVFKKQPSSCLLIPIAFTLGIIPPSMTNEGIPHALRAIGAFPFLEITAALGLGFLMETSDRWAGAFRVGMISVVSLLILYSSLGFVHTYFTAYRATSQKNFQYGMAEAIRIAERDSDRYDHVVLSPRIRGAHVFVLFFTKQDPADYQADGRLGKFLVDVENVTTPGQYLFVLNVYEHLGDLDVTQWVRGEEGEPFLKLIRLQISPP